MLEDQCYEVKEMMFEGRRRAEHLQGTFLLLAVLTMREFSSTDLAPMVEKSLLWDAPFGLH